MNVYRVVMRAIAAGLLAAMPPTALTFQDSFTGSLQAAWQWLDEDDGAWNLTGNRLNVKRYSGNGFYGNVKVPVLYYPRIPLSDGVVAQVKVGFEPDRPYGQAGLIFFYDNDNYAKYVLEYWYELGLHVIFLKEVNGVPCHDKDICEKDVFLGKSSVELRIRFDKGKFITQFRQIGEVNWTDHFTVDAIPNKGSINVGLFSQADKGSTDWAWFDDFSLNIPSVWAAPRGCGNGSDLARGANLTKRVFDARGRDVTPAENSSIAQAGVYVLSVIANNGRLVRRLDLGQR